MAADEVLQALPGAVMEDKRAGRDALSQLPSLTLRASSAVAFSALVGVKAAAKAGLLTEKRAAAVQSPLAPARCRPAALRPTGPRSSLPLLPRTCPDPAAAQLGLQHLGPPVRPAGRGHRIPAAAARLHA